MGPTSKQKGHKTGEKKGGAGRERTDRKEKKKRGRRGKETTRAIRIFNYFRL